MFLLAHLAAGYLAVRLWNLVAARRRLNVWLGLFGGILPDLIDKPLSFAPGVDSGRSIAHSLLFLLVVAGAACRYRALVPVAIGISTHLVLDDPSVYLQTLFWPLFGPQFTYGDNLSAQALEHHLLKPRTLVAEIIGGLVLLWVAIQQVRLVGWFSHDVTIEQARAVPSSPGRGAAVDAEHAVA
jgi:hypothetical protein